MKNQKANYTKPKICLTCFASLFAIALIINLSITQNFNHTEVENNTHVDEANINVEEYVNTNTDSTTLSVIKDQPFDLMITSSADIIAGNYEGVYFEPTNAKDCISVSGEFNEAGYHPIEVNGTTFLFNVIEEPNSANVSAILH